MNECEFFFFTIFYQYLYILLSYVYFANFVHCWCFFSFNYSTCYKVNLNERMGRSVEGGVRFSTICSTGKCAYHSLKQKHRIELIKKPIVKK